jgi:hypothetical protein
LVDLNPYRTLLSAFVVDLDHLVSCWSARVSHMAVSKKVTKKKTTKKTSAKGSAKKTIASRTKAINDAAKKPGLDRPNFARCIRKDCGEPYNPKAPEIADLKNNPGYCSVSCGYKDTHPDVPVKAPGKPSKPLVAPKQGNPLPVLSKPATAAYIPSELQGKAIGSAGPKSTAKVQTIDAKTGEILEQHPAELVLRDEVEGYYSHSTIKSLASCSAAVYYRKTGVKGTPAYALERGSAAHGALECFQKTQDADKAMQVFEENWKLMVLDKAGQMKPSDQEKIRLGYLETKRMVEEFIIENGDVVLHQSKPSDAEVEFSIEIDINMGGGSFKRRIFGKMDWVKWTADRKSYSIIDYKTSGQAPPDNELDRDTQFAIYQLAGTKLYGFPPSIMTFYYLKGQHICGGKFTKEHPRPTTAKGMEKCLQFAFDIPIKTDKEIQAMIDTYYGPVILAHEIGLITKNLSDARKCVSMCMYKDYCDTVTSLPMPHFARLA